MIRKQSSNGDSRFITTIRQTTRRLAGPRRKVREVGEKQTTAVKIEQTTRIATIRLLDGEVAGAPITNNNLAAEVLISLAVVDATNRTTTLRQIIIVHKKELVEAVGEEEAAMRQQQLAKTA